MTSARNVGAISVCMRGTCQRISEASTNRLQFLTWRRRSRPGEALEHVAAIFARRSPLKERKFAAKLRMRSSFFVSFGLTPRSCSSSSRNIRQARGESYAHERHHSRHGDNWGHSGHSFLRDNVGLPPRICRIGNAGSLTARCLVNNRSEQRSSACVRRECLSGSQSETAIWVSKARVCFDRAGDRGSHSTSG